MAVEEDESDVEIELNASLLHAFRLRAVCPPLSVSAAHGRGFTASCWRWLLLTQDDEPAFLRGQTGAAADMSPVKVCLDTAATAWALTGAVCCLQVVRNPDGTLNRAALTQSALAKERREMRDNDTKTQAGSVPRDLGQKWEDPMAKPGERHLAMEIKNVGMAQVDHTPQWKKDQM